MNDVFTYAYSVDESTVSQYQLCTPASLMCDDGSNRCWNRIGFQLFSLLIVKILCKYRTYAMRHTQGFTHRSSTTHTHTHASNKWRKNTFKSKTKRWQYANKILKTDFVFLLFRFIVMGIIIIHLRPFRLVLLFIIVILDYFVVDTHTNAPFLFVIIHKNKHFTYASRVHIKCFNFDVSLNNNRCVCCVCVCFFCCRKILTHSKIFVIAANNERRQCRIQFFKLL